MWREPEARPIRHYAIFPPACRVVPAALLKEQGVINMNDAMRNVSSVQPLMGGGYGFANNFTSRGLPLSFFRDKMPDGTSPQNGYYRTMYDVERIEVLKGPGSALFGAPALAAAST